MSSSFETKAVNGIDVQFWEGDDASGRAEARRFAASLPRGGEFDDGKISRIESPTNSYGDIEVWMGRNGDVIRWDVPEGYTVKFVSGFESGGTCVTLRRDD